MQFIEDFFANGEIDLSCLENLPLDAETLPQGWMTPLELTLLYNVARFGKGDFLEIGTWIGRSSIAIAAGIRDAKDQDRKLDLNDYGFTSLDDASAALRVPVTYFTESDARPILSPGGSIAALMENLRVRGLLNKVTSVIRGNALHVPLRLEYGVVFCDATHSVQEINDVGPVLARVLKPGSWLVCDDIHNREDLVEALQTHVKFDIFDKLSRFGDEHKAAIGRVA